MEKCEHEWAQSLGKSGMCFISVCRKCQKQRLYFDDATLDVLKVGADQIRAIEVMGKITRPDSIKVETEVIARKKL